MVLVTYNGTCKLILYTKATQLSSHTDCAWSGGNLQSEWEHEVCVGGAGQPPEGQVALMMLTRDQYKAVIPYMLWNELKWNKS